MFIVDLHEMKSTTFAKSTKAETDIELWRKWNVHINLNKLKEMQSKGVVIGLPTFKEKEIEGVCKACQFGKQHRHPFPKERNVSKGLLDVIHFDVWGPAQTAHSTDVDITCSSSMTSLGTPRSTGCNKRAKCSDTSRNLKAKSKKLLVDIYDAFDWMEARSIHLLTHSATERSSRAQKSANPRSSAGP